jgi:hypothetical protein
MPSARNPVWEPDELILALDLYFKHRPVLPPSGTHPDVMELSQFLNRLPLIPPEQRQANFRNPAGVYMKLANFRWTCQAAIHRSVNGTEQYGRSSLRTRFDSIKRPTRSDETLRTDPRLHRMKRTKSNSKCQRVGFSRACTWPGSAIERLSPSASNRRFERKADCGARCVGSTSENGTANSAMASLSATIPFRSQCSIPAQERSCPN